MKKTRGLCLILAPLIVGFLWIMLSLVFYVATSAGAVNSGALLVFKSFANWLLGVLGFLSLIGLVVGIILLATNKNTKISVKEAISYGWQNSKKHVKKFLLGFGILIALGVINSIFNPQDVVVQSTAGMIVGILVNILNTWIMLGLAKISLDIVYDRKYKITDLFVDFDKTIRYIGAYILTMIITFVGLLLFIFPGMIRSLKLSMVQYLILEKGYNPIKAIKISRKMTKGYVGDIFAISLISGLINILGVLALLVGLIWTVPLMLIASAYVYKKIADHNKTILA